MNIKTFFHKSCLIFFAAALLSASGCATQYGYDYIEKTSVRAEQAEYVNQRLECVLHANYLQCKETRQKLLRDYQYTHRKGLRHFYKNYGGFSETEKKTLFPASKAFPCITWGMEIFSDMEKRKDQSNSDYLKQNFANSMESWGPLVGHSIIFNAVLGVGDLMYYAGGFCWSAIAVPIYYLHSRVTASSSSIRSNPPAGSFMFMAAPVVNLFFPGYVSPDANHGPMQTRDELYPAPVQTARKLHKEIIQKEEKAVSRGATVQFTYRGKTYQTKVSSAGRIVLPFKIYPLPVRTEKITVTLNNYRTGLSAGAVNLQREIVFNTNQVLTAAQRKNYTASRNKSLTYLKRFRAMQQLRSIYLPHEFKQFQKSPAKYLNK